MEQQIVDVVKKLINSDFLKNTEITIRQGIMYNSIVINSSETIYRRAINDILFARIKTSGKFCYIGFNSRYKNDFDKLQIPTFSIESDKSFIRVPLDIFSPIFLADSSNFFNLKNLFNKIFIDSFSFPAFGCCAKYLSCKKEKRCLHNDPLYATACSYRRLLNI